MTAPTIEELNARIAGLERAYQERTSQWAENKERAEAAEASEKKVTESCAKTIADLVKAKEAAEAQVLALRDALEFWNATFSWRQNPDKNGDHQVPHIAFEACVPYGQRALTDTEALAAQVKQRIVDATVEKAQSLIYGYTSGMVDGTPQKEYARQVCSMLDRDMKGKPL